MAVVDTKSGPRSGNTANLERVAQKEAAPKANKGKPRMNRGVSAKIEQFYTKVAAKRYGVDADKQFDAEAHRRVLGNHRLHDLTRQSTDDDVSQLDAPHDEGEAPKVSGMKLYQVLAQAAASELSSGRFDRVVKNKAAALRTMRTADSDILFGEATLGEDYIARVAEVVPEVALALAFSKHPELGGTVGLERALSQCDLPEDVDRLVREQLKLMDTVADERPQLGDAVEVRAPIFDLAALRGSLMNLPSGTFTESWVAHQVTADNLTVVNELLGSIPVGAGLRRAIAVAAVDFIVAAGPKAPRGLAERAFYYAQDEPREAAKLLPLQKLSHSLLIEVRNPELRERIIHVAKTSMLDVRTCLALAVTTGDKKTRESLFAEVLGRKKDDSELVLDLPGALETALTALGDAVPAELRSSGSGAISLDLNVIGFPSAVTERLEEIVQGSEGIQALGETLALYGGTLTARETQPRLFTIDVDLIDEDWLPSLCKGQTPEFSGFLMFDGGEKKFDKFVRENKSPLLLPIQYERGLLSQRAVLERLRDGLRRHDRAALVALMNLMPKIEGLQDLLPDFVSASIESGDAGFAFATYGVAAKEVGTKPLQRCLQELLLTTGSLSLLGYAGLNAEEQFACVMQISAKDERFIPYLLEIDAFPPSKLEDLVAHIEADRNSLPSKPDVVRLLLRLLEQGGAPDTLMRLAVVAGKDEPLAMKAVLERFAQYYPDQEIGRMLLARAKGKDGADNAGALWNMFESRGDHLLWFFWAAMPLAANGTLFTADDLMNAMCDLSDKRTSLRQELFELFLDRGSLMADVGIPALDTVAAALFEGPAEYAIKHPVSALRAFNDAIGRGAQTRLGLPQARKMLQSAGLIATKDYPGVLRSLVRAIDYGDDFDSVASAVKLGPALLEGENGEGPELPADDPERLGNILRFMRHWPRAPVSDGSKVHAGIEALASKIPSELSTSKHPFMDVLELAAHPGLSETKAEALYELGLRWAGDEKELWVLERFYGHAERTSPGKLLALSNAVNSMLDPDNERGVAAIWQDVDLVRRIRARRMLDNVAKDLVHVATSKKVQGAPERIADHVLEANLSSELVFDTLVDVVRQKGLNLVPTLADVSAALGVKAQSTKRQNRAAARAQGAAKELLGYNLPVYTGEVAIKPPKKERMIPTKTWQDNISKYIEVVLLGRQVVGMIGPPACGKTSGPEWLAAELGQPFVRVQGDREALAEEFLGKYKARRGGEFEFETADFIKLWLSGGVILWDEINVNAKKIQALIAKFVRAYQNGEPVWVPLGGRPTELPARGVVRSDVGDLTYRTSGDSKTMEVLLPVPSPDTFMAYTGNPGFKGTAGPLASVLREVPTLQFRGLPAEELFQVVNTLKPKLPEEPLYAASRVHSRIEELSDMMAENYPASLRDLLRLGRRFETLRGQSELDDTVLMARETAAIYVWNQWNPESRQLAERAFDRVWAEHLSDGQSSEWLAALPEEDRAGWEPYLVGEQKAELMAKVDAMEADSAAAFLSVHPLSSASLQPNEEFLSKLVYGADSVTLGDATLTLSDGFSPSGANMTEALTGTQEDEPDIDVLTGIRLGRERNIPVVWDLETKRGVYEIMKSLMLGETPLIVGHSDSGLSVAGKVVAEWTGTERISDLLGPATEPGLLLGSAALRENAAGKMEPYNADGLLTLAAKAKDGRLVELQHFNEAPTPTLAGLLGAFEVNDQGRKEFTPPSGERLEIPRNTYILATAHVGQGKELGLNSALFNRLTVVPWQTMSREKRATILVATGRDMAKSVGEQRQLEKIARNLVLFEERIGQMWEGNVLDPSNRAHAAIPVFENLVRWLGRIHEAMDETGIDPDVATAFIRGAAIYFDVPESFRDGQEVDKALVRQLAEGMVFGDEPKVEAALQGQLLSAAEAEEEESS